MKFFISFFLLSFSFFSYSSNFELKWDHFSSEPYKTTTQLNDYVFFKMNHKYTNTIGFFKFHSYFIGEHFLDHSQTFYYSAPEMYLSYLYEFDNKYLDIESISITFGRKLHSWSLADEYWEFCLWNPLNRWNPLHPIPKGLIGTFLNIKSKNWSIDMLVGGLYLPSSYTKAKLKDGKISSSQRWFSGAPNKVDILGRSILDIEYLVKIPFILDIFFQQSYVFQFKTWLNKERTVWTKWAYGYKPVNDLFIVTNTNNILELTDMQVSKEISILPVKHTVVSSEWGVDYKNFSALLSFGNTFVQEDREVPEGWEFLHARGHFTYLSALLKYNISSKNYAQVSYLDSLFSKSSLKKESYQDSDKIPFILSQYKILKGLGLDLHIEYSGRDHLKRQWDINYKYSLPDKGGLLFVQGIYYFSPQWYTLFTVDILGAKNVDRKAFLNRFRANDYFGWGLGYVF